MADEIQHLTRAFSGLGGLGVDEPAMVSALAKWRRQPEKLSGFRKSFNGFFKDHGGVIEKCEEEYMLHLAAEFSRLSMEMELIGLLWLCLFTVQNLMVMWAMHPWERDARLAHHVLHQAHPAAIVVEIACTRTAEELLGARKAYQALFHHSLEEDVAYRARDKPYCGLLVGLVSAYRYEGPRVSEETARAEAKALVAAVKSAGHAAAKLVENDDVDLGHEETLREAALCLATPARYFSEVVAAAVSDGADHHAKEALTRVAVTRADVDMDAIRAAYHEQFGGRLEDAVAGKAHGYYRDALLSLVAGGK
ncbi:hypothetical protein OsJ_18373 [Oryza sativa Japonica Group]|uniref:Uncharacterized protein n=1 Tax=Oryza sativa subsp. japonica TaxID=39947 RepID=B9FPC4_ORYSJ|nr:hypothetical protein OsJ_18373 [Oryza sativa Japonica Group]